jgi:cyclophilin family peptidyl-prolyl cis-trans isomerase
MTQAQVSAAALLVQIPGCPNNSTADVKYDANGHFIPTLNISKKVVTLDTTMGSIKVALYDKDAPMAVENFVCLVAKGYYDGITFHRVSHGFVVQAGDPTGTGQHGDSVYGGSFMDELYPDTASYKAGYVTGVLAMANAGPNTNTSQFFILTADHPELPHSYTIFGKVTVGLDVLGKIGSVPVTPSAMGQEDGAPITPITITKATVN